ncbi:hypothetical protein M9Y56_09305 [Pseudomonas juntendi]|uniref:hypothetical protein n=1 Tax=Pseudomonas juntendi TaxID=2666183 RepID=UPI0011B0DE50|nr:hypothetical protein [Pseudomonas juntendi]MCL8329312.1 hypothetical protein [Pseudomonas juntendi]
MSKDTGGPAFPVTIKNGDPNPVTGFLGEEIKPHSFSTYSGLTMRDYFATKALQGLLSWAGDESSGSYHSNSDPAHTASMAYEYADAMLAARVKP